MSFGSIFRKIAGGVEKGLKIAEKLPIIGGVAKGIDDTIGAITGAGDEVSGMEGQAPESFNTQGGATNSGQPAAQTNESDVAGKIEKNEAANEGEAAANAAKTAAADDAAAEEIGAMLL